MNCSTIFKIISCTIFIILHSSSLMSNALIYNPPLHTCLYDIQCGSNAQCDIYLKQCECKPGSVRNSSGHYNQCQPLKCNRDSDCSQLHFNLQCSLEKRICESKVIVDWIPPPDHSNNNKEQSDNSVNSPFLFVFIGLVCLFPFLAFLFLCCEENYKNRRKTKYGQTSRIYADSESNSDAPRVQILGRSPYTIDRTDPNYVLPLNGRYYGNLTTGRQMDPGNGDDDIKQLDVREWNEPPPTYECVVVLREEEYSPGGSSNLGNADNSDKTSQTSVTTTTTTPLPPSYDSLGENVGWK